MFTGVVNFDFRKSEKCALFEKSAAHFRKLMFTGVVNDFRKEKCALFEKSAAHFRKLMFTGVVNFDFRKFKKCAFLKNPPPIFKT